jgi:hypothetical protein
MNTFMEHINGIKRNNVISYLERRGMGLSDELLFEVYSKFGNDKVVNEAIGDWWKQAKSVASGIGKGIMDFGRSAVSGAQQGYSDTRNKNNDNLLKDTLEKYSGKVTPHMEKARKAAADYATKLGISIPLATSILLAGMVGGPAAVPMAALMYFVRKPVNKIAGNVYDKGVEMAQKGVGMVQNAMKGANQTGATQNAATPTPQLAWRDFSSYSGMRDIQEGYFGDKVKQAGNWLGNKVSSGEEYIGKKASQAKKWAQEGGLKRSGERFGKALGSVAGKATNYTVNTKNLISKSFGSMSQFANENKLKIGKVLFLMGVGSLIGYGIGKGVDAMAANTVKEVAPQEDMDWIHKNFKMDYVKGEDGTYEFHGDNIYTTGGDKLGGVHQVGDELPASTFAYSKTHDQEGVPDDWVGKTDPSAVFSHSDVSQTTLDKISDQLVFKDTFTSVSLNKLVDKTLGPDTLHLNFHATMSPVDVDGTQLSVKEMMDRAYKDLAAEIKSQGLTAEIEKFDQMKGYDNLGYYPDKPIELDTKIIVHSASTGGAIGGAVAGAASGDKSGKEQKRQAPAKASKSASPDENMYTYESFVRRKERTIR